MNEHPVEYDWVSNHDQVKPIGFLLKPRACFQHRRYRVGPIFPESCAIESRDFERVGIEVWADWLELTVEGVPCRIPWYEVHSVECCCDAETERQHRVKSWNRAVSFDVCGNEHIRHGHRLFLTRCSQI